MSVDEHPLFEHSVFPMVKADESNGGDGGSRWWLGSNTGVPYVTNEPGEPIEVTGTITIDPQPILPPDDPTQGISNFLSADVNTKQLLYSGPCNMLWVDGCNPDNAANAWVQLFDAASTAAVTLGTTVPKFQFALPLGAGSSTTSGIRSESFIPLSLGFTLGVVAAVTTARSGASTVAVATPVQALINV